MTAFVPFDTWLRPYNHRGSPHECHPLPFRRVSAIDARTTGVGWSTYYTQVARGAGAPLAVRLTTDSPHVGLFFALNWRAAPACAQPDIDLTVRRHTAEHYGLPSAYDRSILVDRKGGSAAITGCEYYTKTKTSLRTLCSLVSGPTELYLHGCAIEVNGIGILICGYSGVGKTTLVNALRARSDLRVRIINDDWGPLSLEDFTTRFTGERRLHTKCRTVAAVAPDLAMSPTNFPAEHFNGDVSDPRARLMIERERLYGRAGVADMVAIDQVWLLERDDPGAPFRRPLGPSDAGRFEGREGEGLLRADYLNGAFLLGHGRQLDGVRRAHKALLCSGKVSMINNRGAPEAVAARLVAEMFR